jgi:arsenate reductase
MWHYPGCDTCRKARRWLSDHGVEHDLVHIVDEPPDRETLRDLWRRSGLPLPKLFNTSGQSYREGGFKDRVKSMTEDEALAALAADGKLIKRPLVSHPGGALVGFKTDTWSEAFSD